jgi:uncharacterized protein YndB with AHSA1/START domain
MTLKAQATIQIQKPIKEVFEAIVNPAMMTNYFISESTGRMEDGAILNWKFPEFPEMDCPVKQIKTEPNKSVSFVWDPETVVHILLTEQADKSVVVTVEARSEHRGMGQFSRLHESLVRIRCSTAQRRI